MNVNELEGAALDAAVAKAEGWAQCGYGYTPSTCWALGGPIIEREGIGVVRDDPEGKVWVADVGGYMSHDYLPGFYRATGPTPLIAAMRAFVASKR